MSDGKMNRKKFLATAGKCCVATCACAMTGGVGILYAQEAEVNEPKDAKKPRSEERIRFAETWITRFCRVMDETLDEETRRKLMMANGRACFRQWIAESGQVIKPTTLEGIKKWVEENPQYKSTRVEGNTIYFQYMSAAETGLPSEEGQCLCPLVETKPEGLSPTYCLCSVGYVKEWHDQLLGKPVTVELVESVLAGGKRCQFKITVPEG